MPVNSAEHKQIMGTELEWSVGVRRVGETAFQSLESGQADMWNAGTLTGLLLPEGLTQKCNYTSNGSRYYIDINAHPEYATPESTSFKDLLISERAGERVFTEALYKFLRHYDRVDEVAVMKRVVDALDSGTGYHFNLSEDRRYISNARMMYPLVWHMATSLPMLGAGHIERYRQGDKEYAEDEFDYRFSWGQKVLQIKEDFNESTTRNRPFINLRDEPHANAEESIRLHIIGNDPHVLDWPAWMMFGTTSLIAAGCRQSRMRSFELADRLEMSKRMGMDSDSPAAMVGRLATHDITDSQKFALTVNGETKHYTANEINMMIMEDAGKVVGKTPEQEAVYRQWMEAAHDRQKDVMSLSLRSDSVTKLASMRRKQVKNGLEIDEFTERDMAYDQSYSTVFRATTSMANQMSAEEIYDASPVQVLRSKIQHPAVDIDERVVKRRVFEPPKDTRANIRGFMVKNQVALGLASVAWNRCEFNDGVSEAGVTQKRTMYLEPLDGTQRFN